MEPGAGAASCHGGTPLRPAGSHDPRQMQHPRLDALLHRRGGSSLLRRHGAGRQVRMEERPAGRLHGRRVAREARQTRAAGPRCRRGLRGSKLHVSLSPWQGGDAGGTPPSPEGTPPRAVLDWRETIMKKLVLSAIPLLAALLTSCAPGGPSYRVYISNEASGDLTVIDPEKMVAMATVAIGKRARGIHSSADGKQIFVALTGSPFAPPGVDESTLPPPDKSADGIGIFDVAQNKFLRKVPGGSDPEQFAIGKDGLLYVSNEDAAGLSFVDPVQGTVLATVPTGAEPEGVTLTPDAKFVYVTSEDKGTVTVVDTATRQAVKTIPVGRRPRGIVFLPDESRAYVTNENDATLSVIDTARLAVAQTISVGARLKPMGMAMSRDGAKLYVTTGRGKKVVVLETATGNIAASFEVGDRPWGIALSPDEKLLFTANGPSNDVSIVDVATRTMLKKVKVGEKPWGVLVVGR